MEVVVLVIHLFIALALTATILLQRSEGGGLGIGGGGTGGGLFSARGAANVLTRATAMLAAAFFVTSITLTLMARHGATPDSIITQPGGAAPISAPGTPPPLDPLSALGGSSTPAAPAPAPDAPAAPAPEAAPPAAAPPSEQPAAPPPATQPQADTSDVPVPTSKPNSP